MLTALIFSGAALFLSGFSFLYLRSYIKRRTGAERILADFQDEVDKIIAGIDSATDRNLSLVEDKLNALKEAVKQADQRIAVYARELDRRSTQEEKYQAVGHRKPVENAIDLTKLRESVPVPMPKTKAKKVKPDRPLREQIKELGENGFSEEAIANKLGITVAEVELALAITSRTGSGGARREEQ
jgi:hypothetical protein